LSASTTPQRSKFLTQEIENFHDDAVEIIINITDQVDTKKKVIEIVMTYENAISAKISTTNRWHQQ
jgi:hypothetical protein